MCPESETDAWETETVSSPCAVSSLDAVPVLYKVVKVGRPEGTTPPDIPVERDRVAVPNDPS